MNKFYEEPKVEVIKIDEADIIRTSGNDTEDDWW